MADTSLVLQNTDNKLALQTYASKIFEIDLPVHTAIRYYQGLFPDNYSLPWDNIFYHRTFGYSGIITILKTDSF